MTPMGPTTTTLSEEEDVQAVMHRHAAMEKREVSEANTGQRDQQRREALQKPEEQVAQDPAMTPIDPLSEAGTSDGDGFSPIHAAVIRRSMPTLSTLLRSRFNANARNKYLQTPLHP